MSASTLGKGRHIKNFISCHVRAEYLPKLPLEEPLSFSNTTLSDATSQPATRRYTRT